ncbi:hypothetical protein ABH960_005949, partial [Bacillus sp. RC252]
HPYSQCFDIIIKNSDEAICLEKNTFEFYRV